MDSQTQSIKIMAHSICIDWNLNDELTNRLINDPESALEVVKLYDNLNEVITGATAHILFLERKTNIFIKPPSIEKVSPLELISETPTKISVVNNWVEHIINQEI